MSGFFGMVNLMVIEGSVEAFGQAFALGILFWFIFAFLLFACMVATAVIIVLYGLRVATYATVLGMILAVPSGVAIGTITGSMNAILTAIALAFSVGVGLGYVRWRSGPGMKLAEGRGYRVLLVVVSLTSVGVGILFWAFLVGTVGMVVWEAAKTHPGGFLRLLLVTLAPVATGGYVLKHLTLTDAVQRREPA